MKDELKKQYIELCEKAVDIRYIVTVDGAVSLGEYADKRKVMEKDIFELGLMFIADGVSEDFMEKIFTNLLKQETNTDQWFLKNLQKEAIMAIKNNASLYTLKLLLNSYTDRTFEEDGIFQLDDFDNQLNIKDAVHKIKSSMLPDR